MSTLKAIAAVALNSGIGMRGKIPWHIADEFKHFKATTMGGVIVFGRRTWESIGKRKLPGRENVVITSDASLASGADKTFKNVEDMLAFYKDDERTIWICGGAHLYRQTLPMCSELLISKINMTPQADAFFPDFSKWFDCGTQVLSNPQFSVVLYKRK